MVVALQHVEACTLKRQQEASVEAFGQLLGINGHACTPGVGAKRVARKKPADPRGSVRWQAGAAVRTITSS